jgi:predicted lipase
VCAFYVACHVCLTFPLSAPPPPPLLNPQSNTELDLFGYIGYDSSDNSAVVVFRGTQPTNIENIIIDLKAGHYAEYSLCDGCSVHDGFLEAISAVRNDMLSGVASVVQAHSPSSIKVIGHSLGGAMATLAAVELAVNEYSNIVLMTFGEPRVGNKPFADWFDSQTAITSSYRVVNQHDMVPHLPPMLLNYHHVSTEVWFNTVDDYSVCNGSGEDPNCSDSVLIPDSIYDHLHYFGIYENCDSSAEEETPLVSNKVQPETQA